MEPENDEIKDQTYSNRQRTACDQLMSLGLCHGHLRLKKERYLPTFITHIYGIIVDLLRGQSNHCECRMA